MSDKKNVQNLEGGEAAIAKAKDFWTRYNKPIIAVCAAIILLGGGWLVYQKFFKNPNEKKADEAMYMAESYYRKDSFRLALNGDGQNWGFEKIISKYGGTKAGNLAHFYAGICYTNLDDNANAVKHLKKFSTSSKQAQQTAYKLLGDNLADMNQPKDALDYYKKAAHYFEDDKAASAAALFSAAYLADKVLKDSKEAITLYKELKEKYPTQNEGRSADLYLAQLGEYNAQ
jgi:tetratricopeptide (TPR) repeat protein